jgi:hypothetical protein
MSRREEIRQVAVLGRSRTTCQDVHSDRGQDLSDDFSVIFQTSLQSTVVTACPLPKFIWE